MVTSAANALENNAATNVPARSNLSGPHPAHQRARKEMLGGLKGSSIERRGESVEGAFGLKRAEEFCGKR
jgi:hypothetical protein